MTIYNEIKTINKMSLCDEKAREGLNDLHEKIDYALETGIVYDDRELRSQIKDIEIQLETNIDDYNTVINNILNEYENPTITFKEGVHHIEKIVIENKHNFKITSKKGAILKLKDNSNNSLLWIKNNCSNVTIENIVVDGNKDKQTHISNDSTPYVNNTGLLLIQSHETYLNNIIIENSRIYALRCCSYTDTDEFRRGVVLNNITVNSCYGGVECTFCYMPKLTNIKCTNIGGEFVDITSVNGNLIGLSKNIVHNYNPYLPIYNNNYNVVSRVKKSSQIGNSNEFVFTDIEGDNSISSGYKVFEIKQLSNGIIANHCDYVNISNCYVENTTLMGIGIINTKTQSLIDNCKAINTAEEGICLDGTSNSKIINSYVCKSATCSNAPSLHVANISPGIANPHNNAIENNVVENSFHTFISSGLTGGVQIKRTVIKNNILTNEINLNNLTGVLVTNSIVENNVISNFKNGINYIAGNSENVIKNNIIKGQNNKGVGIEIINASHIPIFNNTILNFNIGVSNGEQGGNKVYNNYIDCNTSFDVGNKAGLTYFINNFSSNNELVNGVPQYSNTKTNKTINAPFSQKSERIEYTNPINLTFFNGYILYVQADGGFSYPSTKVYFCYFGKLILISDDTEDKSVINVNAVKQDGNIVLSVEGVGGGKSISYNYNTLI